MKTKIGALSCRKNLVIVISKNKNFENSIVAISLEIEMNNLIGSRHFKSCSIYTLS